MSTELRYLTLLVESVGLALVCAAIQPRALRTVWSAAVCLVGALLGLPLVGVLAAVVLAVLLTWPVRQAWT